MRLGFGVLAIAALLASACSDDSIAGAGGGSELESSETASDIEPIAHRLLAEDLAVGEWFSTFVIASEEEFGQVAAESGLEIDEVDFGTDVVFVFGFAESSTPACAIAPIEGLVYDRTQKRIYPSTRLVGPYGSNGELDCNGDANPHRVVVAVPRAALPKGEFSLWLDSGDPPFCCGGGRTLVAAGELTGS